ncbi:MAG: mechanosensitive ion channel family protein [Gammaproteobacteria bacterium]|nr:mechanosensitive ion channel family protein [Gammaproteobacteria bacterium]
MDFINYIDNWQIWEDWIIQVFVVVFITLLLDFLQRRILVHLHKQVQATKTPWDDALIESAQKPASLLIWAIGITFAAEIIYQETEASIFMALGPIRDIGIITAITWFLVRLTNSVQVNLITINQQQEKDFDRTTIDAITKLTRLSIIITSALVAMQTLGFSISGVLAFGGIGGIAVGFAAKDLLANFFGGLMIYLDRPFAVGDWIRSPDRNIEGTVESIGWRLTRIRSFDKRPIYIPNSIFMAIAVENPQRMSHRRIYETIGIRYDDADKMAQITQDVRTMLQNHEAIDTSQTLMVNFTSFAPSSLDFFVYTFTHTTVWTEFHEIKQDVLLKINAIIAQHGAEIAFPTSTLHLAKPLPSDMMAGQGNAE